MITTHNNDPNFSIALPGLCNAECSFCFNKKHPKFERENLGVYLINLSDILSNLGDQFYQISLTGSEPMLSPFLEPVLGMITLFRNKYTNILLTTNGTDLIKNIDLVCSAVDHINISRHHFDEVENCKIFGGSYEMNDSKLEYIIDECGKRGVDVSVNCVISDSTTKDFIDQYIEWSKIIGLNAVRFRKENSDMNPPSVELEFEEYKPIWEGECPVCRTTQKLIKGVNTYWKNSVLEPSDIITDEIFELVYQPDGKLYKDWVGEKFFDHSTLIQPTQPIQDCSVLESVFGQTARTLVPSPTFRGTCGRSTKSGRC